MVGILDLIALLDFLPKDAVFVTQSIPHRGNRQAGQRIHEARRQPSQAAIAQAGIGFSVDNFRPILTGDPNADRRGRTARLRD